VCGDPVLQCVDQLHRLTGAVLRVADLLADRQVSEDVEDVGELEAIGQPLKFCR
jgi:hypothetical protein